MKTIELTLQNRNLKASINVLSACVIINTEFDGFKRSTSYSSIEDAIKNTTLIPVKQCLKILATSNVPTTSN